MNELKPKSREETKVVHSSREFTVEGFSFGYSITDNAHDGFENEGLFHWTIGPFDPDLIDHQSIVSLSICEVNKSDPDNPIPIDGSAFPRIYNVVPMDDKLALNATPNWTSPIFLMASFMIQS